jgi:hypothetical protein
MKNSAFKYLAVSLFLLSALGGRAALAQSSETASTVFTLDAEVGFSAFHNNAGPGLCGCFYFYGANGQIAVRTPTHFSYVFDYNWGQTNNTNGIGHNIALSTYLSGVRFSQPVGHRLTVFGEALAGLGHSDTNFALDQNVTKFAAATGGGLNLRLSPRLEWRVAEIDYVFTNIPNGQNNDQNIIRYNTGVVIHFTPEK